MLKSILCVILAASALFGQTAGVGVFPPASGGGCVPAGSVGQLLIDSGAGACSSSGDFTISSHTLAGGASAVLDLHLMATSAFKVPGGFASGLLHVTTTTGATAGGLLVNADIGNASIDPAKLVGGTFGAGNYIFPANVTVGTSLSVDASTGIAATSKLANVALNTISAPLMLTAGVPSASTSANIIALWSGTCNSGTVLAGDGSCAAVSTAFSGLTPGVASTAGTYGFSGTTLFGMNHTGGALPSLPSGTSMYNVGSSERITVGSIANPAFFTSARWDGTVGSLTAVQSGEQIGGYNSWAYDGATLIGPLGSFRCFANQNQSVGAGGTYCEVATTPNGSTTIASGMRWQATGGVTLPSTVTGGDKGAGTFNATGLYQSNVQVATLSGTEGLTNKTYNGNTWTAGTGVLTIAAAKTLTANNTLTITATDGITMTTPTTSFTAARTDAANTFTGHQTIEGVTSTGATGTGNLVFSASPTFTGTITGPAITGTTITSSGSLFAGSGQSIAFTSSTRIQAPSNGIAVFLNTAQNDFTRLDFGASGATGPALTTTIQTNPILAVTDATGGKTAVFLPSNFATVSVLPSCATAAFKGSIANVLDASSPTIGSTVAGGASAFAQVVCNGTYWTVTGI